jgi:hypothetical protein
VLLTGLQGKSERGPPVGVDRDPDQPARQVALQAVAYRHVAGVRTAVEHRDTEPLGRPDDDVGTQRARRLQQDQGQRVGHDHGDAASVVGGVDRALEVYDQPVGPRIRDDHTGRVQLGPRRGQVGNDRLDPDGLGPGLDDCDRLREQAFIEHDWLIALALGRAVDEGQRFGGGRPLVQQGCVSRREPGQVRDDCLEVEQRLEPALRDLRLVRRVGGVPRRVFKDVAADHGRRDCRVVAQPDHRDAGIVPLGECPQVS